MLRRIVGFRQDDHGDWIADLACLHRQHVRHQPPFQDRGWVQSEAGRESRVGTEITCPLCDRAEMPEGLRVTRSVGPFNADTLPGGLRRNHRVADGMWGLLRVINGTVGFWMATDPPLDVHLAAGEQQAIPPMVDHRVVPEETMEIVLEFLARDDANTN